jgi:hypothetical protein
MTERLNSTVVCCFQIYEYKSSENSSISKKQHKVKEKEKKLTPEP